MSAAASRRLCSVLFYFFFWPAFHHVPVVCDAQRRFAEMFLNHVFLTWLACFLEPLPPCNSASLFAGSRSWELLLVVSAAVAWKHSRCRRPPSTKASLPTCPPSILFRPGPKRKASLTVMHHPSHPPHPWPLTHGQGWQLCLISWWGGKKNSRQNTSSRGGTTEHGNSCGPAVSQVQGISLCAWSQGCLHLYELLQLCPSPGSHFIYTLIGLRCN